MTALTTNAAMNIGVSANGTSDPFPLKGTTVTLASVVTGAAGSSPSLTAYLDVMDVSGNWFPAVTLTAQTSAGTQTGSGSPVAATPNFTGTGRLRWSASGGVVNVILAAVGQ